jgi:GNAT superfamily N-acetyltransferase
MKEMETLEQLRFGEAEVAQTTTRVFAAYIETGSMRLPVGALSVDKEHDSVELVFVQMQFRRKGVAKALLAVAQAEVGRVLRDTGYRSVVGAKWAGAVGLVSDGHEKELGSAEAEGRGNGLMIPLYTANMRELERPEGWTLDSL